MRKMRITVTLTVEVDEDGMDIIAAVQDMWDDPRWGKIAFAADADGNEVYVDVDAPILVKESE